MSASIHSFQGFKDERARKEQEREENYAKIPKLKTGKAKKSRGLSATRSNSSTEDPRDLSSIGRRMDKIIDKVEQALFDVCSDAEAVECGEQDDLPRALASLAKSKEVAWRAYADLREARKAAASNPA